MKLGACVLEGLVSVRGIGEISSREFSPALVSSSELLGFLEEWVLYEAK